MKPIKDKHFLNMFKNHFKLTGEFCSIHKYYGGDSDKNSEDKYLPTVFDFKGGKFKLKYFDGCFYPYLVKIAN